MTNTATARPGLRLGLRANLAPFALLVGVNALVGGMIGQERTVLPLLADEVFGLEQYTAALTYIVAFGVVKAATSFFAGTLSDRDGRKPVLVADWLVGVPVPLLLMWAPTWGWVVFANVLLGMNQGLTWSTSIIMKIDPAGPERRGLAVGLNEAAGYLAVAGTALATGYIAQHPGLRPEPFFLGVAYAGLGVGLSAFGVRETHGHARHEAKGDVAASADLHDTLGTRQVFVLTSLRERALSSVSQAGLVNDLNDGLAWGLSSPVVRRARTVDRGDRHPRRALPRSVGCRPARDRAAVGPARAEVARRRGHVDPGGGDRGHCRVDHLRPVGGWRGARRGHRDGVSDAARRDRRRRPPSLARVPGRRAPALARRGLRRRRHPRRRARRRVRHRDGGLGRRCPDRSIRRRGRGAHVRDAPTSVAIHPASAMDLARRPPA